MSTTQSQADVDFAAAMHEADSNLEVRRLMLVLTNVLTPACVMAVSDCLTGASPIEAVAWLPRAVVPIAGALLLVSGVLVTGVVARCHFGLVVNGTKLKKVETGALSLRPLNWLGVTTNFVALTALSAALGAMCLVAGLGHGGALAWSAGGAVAALLMAWLPVAHARANRLCEKLDVHWQSGDTSTELRAEHARKSLDGTSADISVVVVMAVALFAGLFNALTNLGAIPADLVVVPSPETIQRRAPFLLLLFLLCSLLLSLRILVRLRLAFGEYSQRLAALRDEQDPTAMRWRLQERTYLLYAIVLALAVATAVMLGWERRGPMLGFAIGGALTVAGGVWYPLVLWRARRKTPVASPAPGPSQPPVSSPPTAPTT
ncbi:MAG: hypothetical protein H6835_10890 [Planctomycetes bacterium]|nr:hypothetical protein [Planctomycetota bacterium]